MNRKIKNFSGLRKALPCLCSRGKSAARVQQADNAGENSIDAMETYFWVGLILFCAGVIHGLSGFGSVLISIPLLAFFLDIKAVIPLANLAAVTMTLMIFFQLRRQFDWRKVWPLMLGAAPGIALGVLFLKHLDSQVIRYVLGGILVVYSVFSLLFKLPYRGAHARWAYAFGFLSGCFGGAFGASGPPIIVYTSLQSWDKDQLKAVLQGYFFLSGLMVVGSHILAGITTVRVLKLYMAALPVLVLGTFVGMIFYGLLREEGYRKVILIVLALLGVMMICPQ